MLPDAGQPSQLGAGSTLEGGVVRSLARLRWIAPLLMAIALAVALPALAFAQQPPVPSPLRPVSPNAASIVQLHTIIMGIALVIFLIVEGLLIYSIIRFRQRDEDEVPRQIYGSVPVEIAWTVAPSIVVVILMILTFRTMRTIAEVPEGTIDVQVMGHQWWWEFTYPDHGIVTASELHVPVDEVVRLELGSADVVHSFWPPQLAGKTDAMPGRVTRMWFRPTETGVYQGQCAEFCGAQHANMRFLVVVESRADFDAWVAQQTAGTADITADPAQRGEEIFMQSACVGCHAIEGTNAQGQTGPNLTHVGSRRTLAGGLLDNTPENMAAWIENPQGVKPGNLMPNLELTAEEVDALVVYLQSLE